MTLSGQIIRKTLTVLAVIFILAALALSGLVLPERPSDDLNQGPTLFVLWVLTIVLAGMTGLLLWLARRHILKKHERNHHRS